MSIPSLLKSIKRLERLSPIHWLSLAFIFHVLVTVVVFLVGHFRLLPGNIDENGFASFAVDSTAYRQVIIEMVDVVSNQGFSAWLNAPGPLHCRLYAPAFLFLGGVFGYNVLTAEPVNVIYYLAILVLIYWLGVVIFDSKAGLIASIVVAVWPSFVVHSTQLLRDSVSTALLLSLFLILAWLLQRKFSWRNSLLLGMAGLSLVTVLWLARGNLWNLVDATLAIATILLIVRMVRERQLLGPNLIVLIVIVTAAVLVPARIESTTLAGTRPPTALIAIPSGQTTSSRSLWAKIITQIQSRRGGFKTYTAQESNIDEDVIFRTESDVIKYLPRAVVVGFFAPFPRMWFEVGSNGRAAHLVSGLETFIMYLLYLPAGYCVWINRRNFSVWLIFLAAFIAMTALGLVVVNAGALYRVRYVFWMLVIVLAAEGIRKIVWRPHNYAEESLENSN